MANSNLSINLSKEAILKITEGIIKIMHEIYGRGFSLADNKPSAFFNKMFDVALTALIGQSKNNKD